MVRITYKNSEYSEPPARDDNPPPPMFCEEYPEGSVHSTDLERVKEIIERLRELGCPVDNLVDWMRERGGNNNILCPIMNECGYKHNCSHAQPHAYSEEFCRGRACKVCPCKEMPHASISH